MNFNKMEVTDLLSDESFINYCKKSSPADIAFWERYIKENPQSRTIVELAKEQYLALFNELANADPQLQAAHAEHRIRAKELKLQQLPRRKKNGGNRAL